jgi:hypothetical protein
MQPDPELPLHGYNVIRYPYKMYESTAKYLRNENGPFDAKLGSKKVLWLLTLRAFGIRQTKLWVKKFNRFCNPTDTA